jgi:predicted nucleic acid-binding protein
MPAVCALDTSCLIAAVCGWHEQHRATAAEIERRLDLGERLSVAAHALSEAYAVLTRLPPPNRLAPGDAWELLRANFSDGVLVVALSARQHVALLRRLARAGVSGGRTYDGVIAECAVRAGAQALLTFNARHFEPAPPGLAIVVPVDGSKAARLRTYE